MEKDRRIRKSKEAIQDALIKLIEEKDLSAISIKELVDKADVNRKTFYNHYTQIEDVLDEIENDMLDDFFSRIRFEKYSQNLNEAFLEIIDGIIRMIDDNNRIRTLLTRTGSQSKLLKKAVDKEKEILYRIIDKPEGRDALWLEYFLNFFASGTMAVFETWFYSGQETPIEDISFFFRRMSHIYKDNWYTDL